MKRIIAVVLSAMLLLAAVGCNSAPKSQPSDNSVNANVELAPVTVTMFGYTSDVHSDIPKNLQALVTQHYPNITLEYEAFPTGADPYTDELTRRIAHGKEADIFMTANTKLSGNDALLDLTQEEFVGRYSISILQEISNDGSVWMLPGIGSVMCLVYNTEHFPVAPQTLAELEEMTTQLTKSGIHSFAVPYEQSRPLMLKALAAGYLSSPNGQIWLKNYNQGKGTMQGNAQMEAVWDIAQRMIDNGVLIEEDMVFAESRRLTRMVDGHGAMSTITSGIASTHIYRDGPSSVLTLMPFVGDKPENRNAFCEPTCYYAASARLGDEGNEAKRDAAMKILDLISTQEGQSVLCGTTPLANSYLQDVTFELDEQYNEVSKALQSGAYGPAPTFERGVDGVIGDVFGKMLTGKMTADEAIIACDEANKLYVEKQANAATPVKIGTATQEFPWSFNSSRAKELAVTNFVTDSMRLAADTDIALELGTAVRGEFFEGDITDADINSVVRVDKKLYRAQVTGDQIWRIIEQGVIKDASWFMVVSGLKYSYQPISPKSIDGQPMGKLLTVELSDGTPIDAHATYTVAVSENQMLEFKDLYNFFGSPAQELELTLRQVVTENIKKQGEITPRLENRITIMP